MQNNLSHLYKKIAEELDIDPSTVEEMEKALWWGIRKDISEATGYNILVNKFVNFLIPVGKIEKYKIKLEESYKRGNMTEHKFQKGINNLEEIENKIKQING